MYYADGSTGWKNATDNESGLSYELDFGSEMDFSNIMVYGVDTDASDIIKSFDLDYWDSTTSAWETFKSITNNTSKDVSIYFPTGISTSKFRLNDMVGTDSRVRMLDFQAYEPLGLAALAEYELSKVTDISTGILDSSLDGIEDSMDVLDEEILSLSSRLDIEEDRMRAKFVELEKMMGSMNQTSSWLSQQTSTLNNVWNYKG